MLALKLLFWTAWAVVAYTYIVFPLLLALIARLFGKHDQSNVKSISDQDLPHVAMVVAAYNEQNVIEDKLRNTWALDYPADRFELVVGSDGSTDATDALLTACNDPRLRNNLFNDRRGKISVLNSLMSKINADILIMSDANTMFAPDSIRKLVSHFADPRVGCSSGKIVLEDDGGVSGEGIYWRYESWIKRNESRLGFLIGCNGGIFAIRRDLFESLPASTIVEDFVLSMRILERGYEIRFDPSARGTEPPCASSKAEMVRKIRIGAGGFQALALTRAVLSPRYGMRSFAYWGHKVLRWFVPLFLLTALIVNVALAVQPLYAALLLAQASGIGIGIWTSNFRPEIEPPKWARPISYFYVMNFALLRGFVRFVSGTQRVTWERATFGTSQPASASANAQVETT
jgi:cellulose synthase/poly-beta-1,6-N-acetylglucosamine synthase-like glycosyltransferase